MTSASSPSKSDLRQRIRAHRQQRVSQPTSPATMLRAAHAVADETLRVLATLPQVTQHPQPRTVTVYESWETEPPTSVLISRLLDAGYRVLTPITLEDLDLSWRYITGAAEAATEPLQHRWTYGDNRGVDAITHACCVLTPALSVDSKGTRLGQGGGCYDRALARVDASVPVIALVFDDEFTTTPLPHDEHDMPVHGALTPSGPHWCSTRPDAPPGPPPC